MKQTTTLSLTTTAQPLTGGADAVAGIGQDYLFGLAGSFNTGDLLTWTLTDLGTGYQTQFGAGNVTGIAFTFVTTFDQKVYGLGGKTVYFSAIEQPTVWNDPNAAGNGFITMSNFFATQQDLTGAAPYQGGMLFTARDYVITWNIDADPSKNSKRQILPNIGTLAPLSVQAVGDMDVYMLADNGVRSVRVRDASNNAIIADIGTPIDDIVQPILATLTDAQKAASCGVVEPKTNRYWIYIPKADGSAGKIYVFSYFTSSGIAAWGTYEPTYQATVTAPGISYPLWIGQPGDPFQAQHLTYNGLVVGKRYWWTPGASEASFVSGSFTLTAAGGFTADATTATVTQTVASGNLAIYTGLLTVKTDFVPTSFIVSKGQVWARSGDLMLCYGGSDNATYDACGLSFKTPYIDGGTPATKKQLASIDVAFEGTWAINGAMDPNTDVYRNIYNNTKSSFMGADIPWTVSATHYSIQGVESGAGYARFSSLMVHQAARGNSG